jgi:hypothetical protein
MAVTHNDLNQFHDFAAEKLAAGQGTESLQELLDLWYIENPDQNRLSEDVLAVQASLRDLDGGERGIEFSEHLRGPGQPDLKPDELA